MSDLATYIVTSITLAKRAFEAAEKMKNAELKMVMADLLGSLADMKMKNSEVVSENVDLHAELKKMKAKLEEKETPLEAFIDINQSEYKNILIAILLLLAKAGKVDVPLAKVTRSVSQEENLVLHLLQILETAHLIIHSWGIGFDGGYRLAPEGRSWLVTNKLIQVRL
ncbi:MAG: hypothetical protein H0X38_05640 [Planctomycetes bacterium]|nr:hypothetical protein [Planctomycetota bacterium]